jgi:hypothetical protein
MKRKRKNKKNFKNKLKIYSDNNNYKLSLENKRWKERMKREDK